MIKLRKKKGVEKLYINKQAKKNLKEKADYK